MRDDDFNWDEALKDLEIPSDEDYEDSYHSEDWEEGDDEK